MNNNFTANNFFMGECDFQDLSAEQKLIVYENALIWMTNSAYCFLLDIPVVNFDQQIAYVESLTGKEIIKPKKY